MNMQQQRQWPSASKESVRRWLRARMERRCPLPEPAQIRRELGWEPIKPGAERQR